MTTLIKVNDGNLMVKHIPVTWVIHGEKSKRSVSGVLLVLFGGCILKKVHEVQINFGSPEILKVESWELFLHLSPGW